MTKVAQPQTWDHEIEYRQRKVMVLADLSLSDRMRLGRDLHVCDHCGRDFCPVRRGVMYCKRSCAVMAGQKRAAMRNPKPKTVNHLEERPCDHCETLYRPRRTTSRFCKPTCRVNYNRSLKRARPMIRGALR